MQKKLVLAAAVAGSLAAAPAAFAEVSLYGLVDIGIQSVDPGAGYNGEDLIVSDNMGTGGSRLGFRANEDLGGGLRALAVMEMGWNTDSGEQDHPTKTFQRQVFAGLAGGFGTLTIGRQYREIFLAGTAGSYNYTGSGVGVFWLNTATGVRQDNLIKYTSPSLGGGLNLVVSYDPEGASTAVDDDDYSEVAVKWRSGPMALSAAVGSSSTSGVDSDTTIVGGQYTFGPTTVYALYSATETGPTEVTAISLTGKYNIGSGDIVASFGTREVDPGTQTDSTLIGLGYYHRLSKTTNLYFTYATMDNDSGAQLGVPRQTVATTAAGEDPSAISVGWVQQF